MGNRNTTDEEFGQLRTVREEGRYGESERDDGQTVEVDEQKDGVRVGVVDDGAVAGRYEAQSRD